MCIVNFIQSQEGANLGNFLMGVVAVVTVVGAGVAAFVELPKWRKRTLLERQSIVAGEVSKSMLRVFQALDLITLVIIDSPEDPSFENSPQKRTYRERRDLDERCKIVSDDIKNFILRSNEAKVFLDDDVNAKIEELWKLWVSTKVDVEMSFNVVDSGTRENDFYNRSFGSQGRAARAKLKEELVAALRPVVRMEA